MVKLLSYIGTLIIGVYISSFIGRSRIFRGTEYMVVRIFKFPASIGGTDFKMGQSILNRPRLVILYVDYAFIGEENQT